MSASCAAPLAPADVATRLGVSRETMERLAHYLELLERWQKAINLVGRSTMQDPWRRHVLDSAQLVPFVPEGATEIADLGSGAGFPGMVLAILGAPAVHLVEADRRKAQFLREVVRALALSAVTVHAERVETLALQVHVVTARAFAPLPLILTLGVPLLRPGGRLLLLKGRRAETEVAAAAADWAMRVGMHNSATDPEGRIVILDEVARRAA